MNWYIRKKAMEDPSAHVDDNPPTVAPEPHQMPLPPEGAPPPHGLKIRPGRKKGKGMNLWRKNRE
jgi:hypothetical protein